MKQNRLDRVLAEMKARRVSQLLVSDPTAVFYLTGRWIQPGERMLVLSIDHTGAVKFFNNQLFAFSEDIGAEIFLFSDTDDPVALLARHIAPNQTLGIDKNWPAHFLLELLAHNKGCTIVNGSPIIDRVRMIKDTEEISLMQESSRVNELAMARLVELVPQKLSEKKMGKMLAGIYDELGADGFSFDPIICYGATSSDPHHLNGDRTVAAGEAVMLDIGCVKASYCSDMTRTFSYQKATDEMRQVYSVVLEANEKAIERVRPGVRFCDIDAAARDIITAAGYGKYFVHRTGHSIGLEDHEFGDVSAQNEDLLEPGMAFSIEPGIYLPGKFGVRIEDLVIVTPDGCQILNKFDKQLTIVG